MKKFKYFFILLFFFNTILLCFNFSINNIKKVKAYSENIEIEFNFNGKKFLKNFYNYVDETSLKCQILKNEKIESIVENLKNMGFSNQEICNYLYPEIEKIFNELNQKFCKKEILDEVVVLKNECIVEVREGKNGLYLDKSMFYDQFIKEIVLNKDKKKVNLYVGEVKRKKIDKKQLQKRGEFITDFTNSSPERKHNIKTALKKFDGLILNEGESFSFNEVTGKRDKNQGYMQAKIISDGSFSQGYGGGVCQVSTTIYNACILSGLEILEVNNHSLPVSYVEPSFDAMVSYGSSDLIVRNNSGEKIIITTSYKGDKCRVVIFGKVNDYNIERISKKIKKIEPSPQIVFDKDYKKYGFDELSEGEEIKISSAKEGFVSEGYLKYYDKNGKFIKTEKIRENIYNPTREVILKKEN